VITCPVGFFAVGGGYNNLGGGLILMNVPALAGAPHPGGPAADGWFVQGAAPVQAFVVCAP
jgi:hypothetical protein